MKTKKRLLSLLLAFCLLTGLMPTMAFAKEPTVSVWDGSSVATAYESGDGTEANPYEIATADQFAYFAQRISSGYETEAYYVLSCDIDLSAANWTPIGGYSDNIFKGIFDGRGHTIRYAISSYSPTGPYYSFIGLFEYVEGDISNLDVEGSITLPALEREVSLGGLSGIFDGNITNCESNVDITYASNQGAVWIGGLTGQYRAGTIQECAYTGAISATGNTGEVLAGGICGALHGGTIDSCKYAGTITCVTADSSAAEAAGGIVGFVITRDSDAMVTVRNCYNEGAVSGSIAGGIIGMVDAYKGEISVENCYSSTMASGTMNQGAVIARSDVGSGTLTVQNCYYLTGTDYYGSKAADLNELYENLSKLEEEGVWIQDTNGVPRLYWEFVVAPEPATFSVTFQDEDGTILDTMSVEEGDAPISLPELKDDDGNRVFMGWWGIDSSGSSLYYAGEKYAVKEDATFIAYWDEIVTLTAPFTTTVELGDSSVPGETVFTWEIVFMGEVDEDMYQDMTISASVTTNGKGDYDGAMTFTGLSQQLKSMLRQGMFVQQVDDGKENWTYDDAVWYLVLADDTEVAAMALSDGVEPEYKILIFQATCEETENGPVYGMDWENTDWDNPEAKMLFTNTYTAHDYTQKYNETEHWDECGCGDVQNREAHQYGEWTVTKESTVTESGEKERTCTVCGYTETAEIEKLPQYTVTFDTEFGIAPAPKTVTKGTVITLPELEDYGGYAFVGWWILDSSSDFGFYSAGEEYEVSRNVTFVAEWDEIVTLTVPFTTTVELGDSGVPGETVFTLDVVYVASAEEGGEDMYEDVTVSASVTTNGEGDYDGTMTFTGPYRQLQSMLREGVCVQQVNDGEGNWTYDDRVWCLILVSDPEVAMLASTYDVEPEDDIESKYKVLIFQGTCEETENGPVYDLDWENMDWDAPEEKMLFTNTYTAHGYTLKYNETEHWDECGCGDVQNREAHQYGEWTVTKEATETESGEKEHICTVCGYTETVEIEKLPATKMNLNTGKGTGNTDTNAKSPKTGDNSNIVLWFSLMLVAGAALSGTVVYARKKKRSR